MSTAIDSDVASDLAQSSQGELSRSGGCPQADQLVVTISSPAARWRGALSEYVDQCLEAELRAHGAPPRSPSIPRNLGDSLCHHLERADRLGFVGLRLLLSGLGLIAEAGVLNATDSNTLRWWLDVQGRWPVVVEVSPDVERLRAYLAPVNIGTLVWATHGHQVASTVGRSLSETPLLPMVFDPDGQTELDEFDEAGAPCPFAGQNVHSGDSHTQLRAQTAEEESPLVSARPEMPPPAGLELDELVLSGDDLIDDEEREPASTAAASLTARETVLDEAGRQDGAALAAKTPEPPSHARPHTDERCALVDALLPGVDCEEPALPEPKTPTAPGTVVAKRRQATSTAEALREVLVDEDSAVEASAPSFGPGEVLDHHGEEKAHLQVWRDNLDRAQGVQSWEDLERLFIANYLPLMHAVEAGQASAAAADSVEVWARNFEQCYASAFSNLRFGGHRPTMVCDIPNLAFQLARDLDSPKTRLVLVDGMRFDLGQRAHDKLRLQLTGVAQCVSRGVLWSALPATTGVQLELLARGPTALRNLSREIDESAWVARGAGARRLRPMRVGGLNMSKLDILEAEFRDIAWTRELLDRGAAEVATSVGRYVRQQQPGTLVVVFSDHGSSGTYDQVDSARPERVLVPYDAWLVGLDR